MKTTSDWIFVVSKYTYSLRNGVHADQQRNLCNTFLLIAPYMLHCLPKKVIVLSLFSKGIYHQISNCIKSMWMWLVKNLQNFCNFQFLAAVASNWYPVTKTSLIDTYINHKPIKKNSCTNYWARIYCRQMIIFTAFKF